MGALPRVGASPHPGQERPEKKAIHHPKDLYLSLVYQAPAKAAQDRGGNSRKVGIREERRGGRCGALRDKAGTEEGRGAHTDEEAKGADEGAETGEAAFGSSDEARSEGSGPESLPENDPIG